MDNLELKLFNFFLTVGICEKETAITVFNNLKAKYNSDTPINFAHCVDAVNLSIKPYDLEIAFGRSEVTGNEYISLVQICELSVAKNAKFPDKKISAFFAKLLTTIVLSDDMNISSTDAVNISSEADITKSNAETAINDFIAEKWLEEKNGLIYLGPRSVMELGSLLVYHYPNANKHCPLCKRNVFFGTSCLSCKSKIHLHCLKHFWQRSAACPSCNKPRHKCFENMEDGADDGPSQRGPSQPKRKRRISNS